MRPDMRYVVIEAGRAGGLTRGRPPLSRDPDILDALPRTSGMYDRVRHYDRKSQTDVLNPLRRWLATQVGRPWSKVYSDFMAHADVNSVTGFHIKSHLLQYVDTHCRIQKDGTVVHGVGTHHGGSYSDYWVDPRNDLLRRNGRRGVPHRYTPTWRYDYEPVLVDRFTQLHKDKGIWWWVTLEPWTPIMLPRFGGWSGNSMRPFDAETDSLGTTYKDADRRYGRALLRSQAERYHHGRYGAIKHLPKEHPTLRAVAIRTASKRDKKQWGIL